MGKIQSFTLIVLMLSVANAWGADFRDDFNRPNGGLENDWATQTNGTIEVKIVNNEVQIAGKQATDWTRSGLSRTVEDVTRISFDFKADNRFNVHLRIDDVETGAYIDVYAPPGSYFRYASSEDGFWPGWTDITGLNTIPGEYNRLTLEQFGTEFIYTLNNVVIGTVNNAVLANIGWILISCDSAAGTSGSLHIDNVLIGDIPTKTAWGPNPQDGAHHGHTWVGLSWWPGIFAVSHDIYFGDNFDDVNDGAVGTFQGTQTATSFTIGLPGDPYPDGLVLDATYYWRVDDVEADGITVHKGDVWSFTVSVVEDFETNDFSRFSWSSSGEQSWETTRSERHSGFFSAESGSIEDFESSTLQVSIDCVSGDITFYSKVSSEPLHDNLTFKIDGVEKGAWSGEEDWSEVSFAVDEGTRTFEWTYSKDGSDSEGDDAAWIDDIVFPVGL
ncbi:MAG: hypothetical protein GY845_04500 [Planctomycetes bacterium]|nr:hypothetical protein [Planctomycetota bacterium]